MLVQKHTNKSHAEEQGVICIGKAGDVLAIKEAFAKANKVTTVVHDGKTGKTVRDHKGEKHKDVAMATCVWHGVKTVVKGFKVLKNAKIYPILAALIEEGRFSKKMIKRQLEYAIRHCGGDIAELRRLFAYAISLDILIVEIIIGFVM